MHVVERLKVGRDELWEARDDRHEGDQSTGASIFRGERILKLIHVDDLKGDGE